MKAMGYDYQVYPPLLSVPVGFLKVENGELSAFHGELDAANLLFIDNMKQYSTLFAPT